MINDSPSPESSSNRTLLYLAIGLSAFVLVGGCAVGGLFFFMRDRFLPFSPRPSIAAPPEAPTAKEWQSQGGFVSIDETFDQPTDRWDQSQARIVDGTYELGITTTNGDNYGLYLGDGSLFGFDIADFDMAVDVTQVKGDPSSEFGIRFRQSGPEDYLMFSVSSTGYYRLVRVVNEVYQSEVAWTFDRNVKTGLNATNRLRVEAKGPSITCFINGQQVIAFTDQVNAAGQLTLGVQSFATGDLAVRFDTIEGTALAAAFATDGTRVEQTMRLDQDFASAEGAPWSVGGAEIVNGQYEIFTGGGVQTWQQPLPSESSKVKDFVLDVDATLISGDPAQVSYGVVFGDGGQFDFYSLLILPTGELTLVQHVANGGDIALVPPIPIESLNPGSNATNKLTVRFEKQVLQITINGVQLDDLTFPDDITVEGMVGMIVVSGPDGLVQARFDNFRLQELADTQTS